MLLLGVTVMPVGGAGTKSALIDADFGEAAESPMAFVATTENWYDALGSSPLIVQTVAVPQSFETPFVPCSRYAVIGELFACGVDHVRVACPPSYDPVRLGAPGASGTSCTEIVTSPQTYRSGSSVASATWYCRCASTGFALSETLTCNRDLSALGVTVTPPGSPPESPRMFTTRSRCSGKGFVGWSFCRTSIVVVSPRFVMDLSAPGWTSGRVDATTSTSTTPLRPWFASSATPMPTDAVVFFFAVSATVMVSFCPRSSPSCRRRAC
ncbi:hypothetical protein P9139_15585 [Curtobacterium flaccumfaciens]|nr:hypothetical protein P9139_15585 [Curtobacterium flaccumfaciens]